MKILKKQSRNILINSAKSHYPHFFGTGNFDLFDTPSTNNRMDAQSAPSGQVQVRFTTRNEDLAVGDTPIFVPTSLKRYGLSQIVNHLLKTGMFSVNTYWVKAGEKSHNSTNLKKI